jgi:hypothetical protein
MKTSNIVIIVGMLIAMGAIAIGASKVKLRLEESIIQPTGNIVEKTYDLAAFSKINLKDNIECTLVKADEQMVKVEMDEAWVDRLSVKVSGDGFLGFDLEGFGKTGPIKVTIHYTDLSMLTLKNASCTGEIIADSIEQLYLIGGSVLDARMETTYSRILVQSGSDATLKGKCTKLNIQSESGSDVHADELLVDYCIAKVESGAGTKLNVNKTLDATAISGGNISYLGNPEIKGLVVKIGGTVDKMEVGSSL